MELLPDDPLTVVSVVPGAFNSGFRPVEPNDAWLVRWYRGVRDRTAEPVAANLMHRLRQPTRRRHRTIRLSWDGPAFEIITRTFNSDMFLAAVDALIGQRAAEGHGATDDGREGAPDPHPSNGATAAVPAPASDVSATSELGASTTAL